MPMSDFAYEDRDWIDAHREGAVERTTPVPRHDYSNLAPLSIGDRIFGQSTGGGGSVPQAGIQQ